MEQLRRTGAIPTSCKISVRQRLKNQWKEIPLPLAKAKRSISASNSMQAILWWTCTINFLLKTRQEQCWNKNILDIFKMFYFFMPCFNTESNKTKNVDDADVYMDTTPLDILSTKNDRRREYRIRSGRIIKYYLRKW